MYSFDHIDRTGKKRRVHLVDTPGFDDVQRSDVEILQEIVFWLSSANDNGFFLNGIIYLQSIAAPRWTASSKRSLEIFKALCGTQNYSSVVLATTLWDTIKGNKDVDEAQARYKKLVDTYWTDLKKGGAHIQGETYGYTWAHQLVAHIVGKGKKYVLQIQSELQIPGANLRDTTAGQTAGELWRLDDHRGEGVSELNQTKEQLLTRWTKNINDDIAGLTENIHSLREQTGRLEHASSPPPYSSEAPGKSEQELLRRRAKDLDRVKQVKLASYGMYVNSAAMIFGGISAGLVLMPLLACSVM